MSRQHGFVLIFVLLVVAVLVLYVLEFHFDSQVDLQLAEYQLNRLKATEISKSALNFVIAALNNDTDRELDSLKEDWAKASSYSQFSGLIFPGAAISIIIEDESGKLNVNELFTIENSKSSKNKKVTLNSWLDERLRSLGENLFNDSSFVDAIIDWQDTDDKEYSPPQASQSGGAEDSYYQKLPFPYSTKSGKLDCLDELILIKGIDERIYLGEGGAESPGLRDLLTIYSDGKININTASGDILQSLHPAFTEVLAKKIVEQREDTPFNSVESFLAVLRENGIKREKKDKLSSSLSIKSSGKFKVEMSVTYQGYNCYTESILQRNENNTRVIFYRVK